MRPDPEALAAVIVKAVTAAQVPVLARVDAAEAHLASTDVAAATVQASLTTVTQEHSALHARLALVEASAAEQMAAATEIVKAVTSAQVPILARVDAAETSLSTLRASADTVQAEVVSLRERPGLSPEDLTVHADVLLRKAFTDLAAASPPRMIRRVVRDAKGKIERVIDEPAKG